jgi:hypothetical protein
MKTTTLQLRNLMNCSPLRAFVLTPIVLACFALAPQARATCQEGCLTNESTALGEGALGSNTTGVGNTAVGWGALADNVTGASNTAVGVSALAANTGGSNVAVGADAMDLNTTGNFNTATGTAALYTNSTGSYNTASGIDALYGNTTGYQNTASGAFALEFNTTGLDNTAIGFEALRLNRQGVNNTALGYNSLYNCRGSSNTAIGISAGMNITRGNNDICIGNVGVTTESNTIRVGNDTHTNTYIAGISGATVPTGVAVIVDSDGHLGTTTSSERFKETVKPMDKASEAILALQPVTFRYKHELDPTSTPQFGLVAEQVEKVNPDLVARDADGKPYSVRYEAVNAMLLNEFIKEHRKVEKLEATVAQQHKDFEAVVAELKGQIQKVSAQLELSRSAPQTVQNSQ